MDKATPTLASIILVPGHWLGTWAWDAVAADLRDGTAFDASVPPEQDEVPLPPFDQLLARLSEQCLEQFRKRAVPDPDP